MTHRLIPSLSMLPVILGLAAILLTLRLGALWQDVHGTPQNYLATPAVAAAETEPKEPEKKADGQPAAAPTAEKPAEPPAVAPAPPVPAAETPDDILDMTEFSTSELDLLQALRQRREQLAQREEEMNQRERMLKALEQRVEGKVTELNTIKAEIESARQDMLEQVKAMNATQDERIRTLVSVYEKMKPQEAARILDNLDLNILLDVVKGMKDAKLAPILAAMDPARATEVTTKLGQRLAVPPLADAPGATTDSAAPAAGDGGMN